MFASSIEVDVIAETAVISACETGQVWQAAICQLQRMEQYGLPLDIISCGATLSACEKGCQWKLALNLGASPALSQSSHVQNSCLAASAKASEWKMVFQSSHTLLQKRGQLDVLSCSSALHACDSASRWQRAVHTFSIMKTRGPHPNVVSYSSAISAVSASLRGGEWALQALTDLSTSRLQANAICFNAVVSACSTASLWRDSTDVFQKMVELGPAPTMVTHGAVMAAVEGVGRWRDVLHCEAFGREAGLRPTLVTCATSLAACRHDARSWVRAVQCLAGAQAETCWDQLWPPTLVVANAFVGACSVAGQWRVVMELLDALRGWVLEPDYLTLSSTASALSASQDSADAWMQNLNLLQKFAEHALQPDYSTMESMLATCEGKPLLQDGASGSQLMSRQLLSMLQTSAAEALEKGAGLTAQYNSRLLNSWLSSAWLLGL